MRSRVTNFLYFFLIQSPDILHPSTSLEWEEWPSLPVGMSDVHVVCMNGTVFVGGGRTTLALIMKRSRDEARLYSFRPGMDSEVLNSSKTGPGPDL